MSGRAVGAARDQGLINRNAKPEISFERSRNFSIELRYWDLSYKIPDTAGTGSDLAAGMTEEGRKRFLQAAVRSRDRLLRAERARSEDTATEHLLAAMGAR